MTQSHINSSFSDCHCSQASNIFPFTSGPNTPVAGRPRLPRAHWCPASPGSRTLFEQPFNTVPAPPKSSPTLRSTRRSSTTRLRRARGRMVGVRQNPDVVACSTPERHHAPYTPNAINLDLAQRISSTPHRDSAWAITRRVRLAASRVFLPHHHFRLGTRVRGVERSKPQREHFLGFPSPTGHSPFRLTMQAHSPYAPSTPSMARPPSPSSFVSSEGPGDENSSNDVGVRLRDALGLEQRDFDLLHL